MDWQVGFKPAGGIRTAKDSLVWLTLMKEELGEEWMGPHLFRLGASTLLADIERQVREGRGATPALEHVRLEHGIGRCLLGTSHHPRVSSNHCQPRPHGLYFLLNKECTKCSISDSYLCQKIDRTPSHDDVSE